MDINLIAMIGENNELGEDNRLIWNLRKEKEFYQKIVLDSDVIMGRKTFESLPHGLPKGEIVVVSSKRLDNYYDISCFQSLEEAILYLMLKNKDIFIVGGQEIYEKALEYVDNMYLTHVEAENCCADAYFPYFDKANWNIQTLEEGTENELKYKIKKYVRKKEE